MTNTKLGTLHSIDTKILLSCLAVVPVSDEEEATSNSEEELDLSTDEMLDSLDDAFVDPPPHGRKKRKCGDLMLKGVRAAGPSSTSTMKKFKKNYDLHRKFHKERVAKEPSSEAILAEDGVMHLVRCKPCSIVRGKLIHMAPKWDTISKDKYHEFYKKCILLYAARGSMSIAKQI